MMMLRFISSFVQRFFRAVKNLLHINRLTERTLLNEARQASQDLRIAQLEGLIHLLEQRLLPLEHIALRDQPRIDALEIVASTDRPRIDALENVAHTDRPRIDALEKVAHTDRPRIDALEIMTNIDRPRIEILETATTNNSERLQTLETSVTPAVEKATSKEVYDQLRQFKAHLNQEKLFFPALVHRPKLALVTPLPPQRSGISDYSAELVPELARFYDVEVIVDQEIVIDSWINTYCPVRNVEWFKRHINDYERIVYQFGNSPLHSYMFALLCDYPGVVVLHDFFLSSVLAYEEMHGTMPGIWTQALLRSHGYHAVKASFGAGGVEFARDTYPCNGEVLKNAQGIIVHSEYSRRLAQEWYGQNTGKDWACIPLLRVPPAVIDRHAAREALGISQSAFLVCSFGFIDGVKRTHELLDAWLASSLARDSTNELYFVGANHPGDYGAQLSERIRNSGCQERIRVTGWLDDITYKLYLQAADMCVQLRGNSRGETSAAVMQCLNYGLPTIVNANGTLAELSEEIVFSLADDFEQQALVSSLELLWQSSARRSALSTAAQHYIRSHHDPVRCAALYQQAIDAASQKSSGRPHVYSGLKQLLFDVSTIVHKDLHSGIERVLRAQLSALLNNPPAGFLVEPVYFTTKDGVSQFYYARTYACKLLGIAQANLSDAPITIAPEDVFYGADFAPYCVLEAAQTGIYQSWRELGVKMHFLVYDLLPILQAEFFPASAASLHQRWLSCITRYADTLVCISSLVAKELAVWMHQQSPSANLETPHIAVVHLGADLSASAPTTGIPDDAHTIIELLKTSSVFLMVGTLEPRKGHLQVLSAFEQRWSENEQDILVIVGKEGWAGLPDEDRRTIPELIGRLRHHPELGKRLFWLQDISDAYLQKIYLACTCLILASEGEGFGLPIIEAAHHGLPILARNLPVFQEVAQEHAFYFEGQSAQELNRAINTWRDLYRQGIHPTSITLPRKTWNDSVEQLLSVLIKPVMQVSVKSN